MFEGLTVWGRLSIIFALVASAVLIVVLLVLILRWAFAGKKVKLGLGSLGSLDVDRNDMGRARGPLIELDLVIEIVSRTVDTASRISHLKTKQILSDQMYYLEDRLVIMQDALMTAFRTRLFSELSKKTAQGTSLTVTSSQEYSFLSTLVHLMAEDIKRNCRGTFIRNNFHRFSERDFAQYLDDKVSFLWIKAVNFLRDMYPSDKMTIPFEEIEKSVLGDIEEDIRDGLLMTFKRAVQIYNERHAEVKGLEIALRDHLQTFGVDLDRSVNKIAEGSSQK